MGPDDVVCDGIDGYKVSGGVVIYNGEDEGKPVQRKPRSREFKKPENDMNINYLSNKKFALQSQKKIKWAVNLYSEWRRNRMKLL